MRSICQRLRSGRRLFMSAAMPATMGDAKDVPHHQVQRTGRVEPVIAQPGADTLVHDPRFDQLYRRLELFDAATLMTPGRAAG